MYSLMYVCVLQLPHWSPPSQLCLSVCLVPLSDFHIGHDQMYETNRSSRETNRKICETNMNIRETNQKRSYVFLPTEILKIIIDNVLNIDLSYGLSLSLVSRSFERWSDTTQGLQHPYAMYASEHLTGNQLWYRPAMQTFQMSLTFQILTPYKFLPIIFYYFLCKSWHLPDWIFYPLKIQNCSPLWSPPTHTPRPDHTFQCHLQNYACTNKCQFPLH